MACCACTRGGAEKNTAFKIEYLEETQGEEAGIKSATIQDQRSQTPTAG